MAGVNRFSIHGWRLSAVRPDVLMPLLGLRFRSHTSTFMLGHASHPIVVMRGILLLGLFATSGRWLVDARQPDTVVQVG